MAMKNRKGVQGIGTLIIFIAMILVAAVAAGVLIQTASSLQSKSLDIGRQSQEKITTDIEVVQVYSSNTSNGAINGTASVGVGNEDSITMIVRLGSGSAPVKLDDLLIKMDTRSGSQTVQHSTTGTLDNANYNVSYISGGGVPVASGYLSTGDLAQIEFLALNDVNEGETATIRLLTKNGAVKPVDLTTPSAMTKTTTYLYP